MALDTVDQAKASNYPNLTSGKHPSKNAPRIVYGRPASLRQCVDLQNLCHKRATSEEQLKPADLAALARAWTDLEEQKRIIRGKPLPGSLKPEPVRKSKANQLPWKPAD